jgi:catalase
MATRKQDTTAKSKAAKSKVAATKSAARGSAKASDSSDAAEALARRAEEVEALAAAMPENSNKRSEYGTDSTEPVEGLRVESSSPSSGSTLSEQNANDKNGDAAEPGANPTVGPLSRVRVDSTGQRLTTNQGVPISDNQSALKAGLRGPALLKDFILREKITHFDHERIPERIVHARGSGAHGFFECYESLTPVTRASVFSDSGKITPVFVRFSTVAGERGSKDTARDARGFAVKFYTDEGNWDLVGNNIPVFFIQDAMKFPDLVHAVKPEPHHGMPQAGSAHDTFWDFVSLMPESTHMLLWVMSDRAIPRSYRMMQGFGVHTFRFVNEAGASTLVKFHWTPVLGTHGQVWDEAVKISGADPDYHRRDLWEAIEAGDYPEWELGVQLFSEAQAEKFSFDVLDATKLVPEELVPVMPIGRMVLNRNPDNFFAETEQVAYCTAHVVPGIDFTNDPLLAGRIHSYVDTQLSRLGGPNFHELPINASIAPVHNNQRDGMHRQAIHRGQVSYEPNSLGGGCPFQAGAAGFVSFPEPVQQDEMRGKPERFAEHFNQATLFFNSQSDPEKAHIIAAFRFELSKVTVPAIRSRVLSMLLNVSKELAKGVAEGLGMALPAAMPRAISEPPQAEVLRSTALSMTAFPGDGSVRTRRVAILVADGADAGAIESVRSALRTAGATAKLVGPRIGPFAVAGGSLDADASLETDAGVLFDALVLPGGKPAVKALAQDGRALEFIKDQYRHCKTILALGDSVALLSKAGVPDTSGPGLLVLADGADEAVEAFIEALAKHRHFERESEPPPV